MPAWLDDKWPGRRRVLAREAKAYKPALRPASAWRLFTKEATMAEAPGVQPDRIDVQDEQALARWAKKLDATPEQVREAVQAVGDKAADVEMHLKGARSTTNSERVQELGD
jgi:hypothetical protein